VRRSHIHHSKYESQWRQLWVSGRAIQNLVNVAVTLFSIQMHNEVDTGLDFCFNYALGLMRYAAQHQVGETLECPIRAICVNCGEHAAMPSIQSVEKSARFGTAHLTHNDPVRPMAEIGFQQVIKSDGALVRIELSLGGDDVRFSDRKLCGVFNDQNAILVGNGIGQCILQRTHTLRSNNGNALRLTRDRKEPLVTHRIVCACLGIVPSGLTVLSRSLGPSGCCSVA